MSISYETVPATLMGNEAGTTTQLTWSSTLGNPDIPNEVASNIFAVTPALVNGTVALTPSGGGFLRGDFNGNGLVEALLDALFVLSWQFNAGPAPPCMDAADANDNGEVNALLDGLYLLAWQFNAGPAPPTPGTEACGDDSTADSVDCVAPPTCD